MANKDQAVVDDLSSGGDVKVRIFISYSRKDRARAELLRDRLNALKLEAFLDIHDILPGEAWHERLGKLIEAAETVVFLISPDSIVSTICDWEVNEAERLGKRILPVIIRETDLERVPGRLKRLNFIFMRDAVEESKGMEMLARAAVTDITWLREHTRLTQFSADWAAGRRVPELLLRGTALDAAESWAIGRHPDGSAITPLLREFIQASRNEALAQAVRRGRTQVLIGLLVLALISGASYLVWLNRGAIDFEARLFMDRSLPTVLAESTERNLAPNKTFKECASCPDMTVIPAGEFMMGSPDDEGEASERPQHKVTIPRQLAVSTFLITFDQWDACMAHGGCTHRPNDRGWGRGHLPVTDVSWEDAHQYVAWLSRQTGKQYRLLAEAEWEYAARAGSTTKYPWGNELGEWKANCPGWASQWENKQPSPVGTFAPNAFGLYDMIGNLWEWVEDNWHPNYEQAPWDGSVWRGGDSSQRVLRGGSWGFTQGKCYAAYRNFPRSPGFQNDIFGIRVARSLAGS